MKVVYISYKDFSDLSSGSKVRPFKIYKAFLEQGNDVILINGKTNQRLKLFSTFLKSNALRDVDYCYIEPSTYPANPLDYIMFVYFKLRKIPIGYFYRDMYYGFPELFEVGSIKGKILIFRYKTDIILFKRLFKVVFFPSLLMADNFNFKIKVSLPPAGEIEFDQVNNKLNKSIVYVGGINKILGSKMLLEAMDIVNYKHLRIKLNLICRKEDLVNIEEYKHKKWLNVLHLSGEDLKEIYYKSDFAVIPRRRNPYFDFSMPVKLFEYMSFGMPIVATGCTEMAKFIESNSIGIIVEDNAASLAKGILYLYDNPSEIINFQENIKSSLISENLWVHRVQKIEKSLLANSNK
ncbi:MAG: glycosyltransferase [Prolixibacteraceae bacterium]|nr:glycosyltransferase [Prolixibacteraceae bacterium]